MTQTNPNTQPKDFSDLYFALLNKVREQTTASAAVSQAKSMINTALQDMHIGFGERFPWAERQSRLTTMAPYSTGTVSITQGSTTLTGVSTLWTTTNAFGVNNARTTGKIVINGTSPIYEISSVGGAGTITLTSAYVGTTVAAGTYSYFEDEYDLHADFLRPMDMQFFDSKTEIKITDRNTFRRKYPANSVTGRPVVACLLDRAFVSNTTPVRRVAFYRPPDANYSIPYSFVTNKLAVSSAGVAQQSLSADTDEPIVPFGYRHLIVLHALYNWYRDKKDDSRSQEAKAEFTDLLLRISGDTEIGERRPSIEPKMAQYRNNARSPYRVGGSRGTHTLGSRFDRMESDY
jgi:hypothetical protein